MKICQKCGGEFSSSVKIDGRLHVLSSRKFCFSCSPFGLHNTISLASDCPATRSCPICNRDLPLNAFYTRSRSGASGYCKECNNKKSVESQQRCKKRCVDYKGGKCQVCSYDRYLGALQFHHMDPEKKDFSVSEMKNSNFEKLRPELDKCVLLCSRCHQEVHGGLHEDFIHSFHSYDGPN